MTKRMQIKLGELAQELAITLAQPLEQVEAVLQAYSDAVLVALKEGMIVEVLRDVRLQVEPYFDPRNNTHRERIAVNDELDRLRRPVAKKSEAEDVGAA